MKKKIHLLPVALAFLIGLGTVGCGNRQKTAGTAPESVKRKVRNRRRRARPPKRSQPIR